MHDTLFEYSSANYITLYEAQENFKMLGCCNKRMKYCRTPKIDEKPDPEWRSIQDIVANMYDIPQLCIEIRKHCELLIQNDSSVVYKNFIFPSKLIDMCDFFAINNDDSQVKDVFLLSQWAKKGNNEEELQNLGLNGFSLLQ